MRSTDFSHFLFVLTFSLNGSSKSCEKNFYGSALTFTKWNIAVYRAFFRERNGHKKAFGGKSSRSCHHVPADFISAKYRSRNIARIFLRSVVGGFSYIPFRGSRGEVTNESLTECGALVPAELTTLLIGRFPT